MNGHDDLNIDARTRAAITELENMIASRYPTATFDVSRGADDPRAVYLVATVDLDDPFEVVDLVIDRVVDLQVDEGIPLRVIPASTPDQSRAQMADWERRHGGQDATTPGESQPVTR
jgi:hypothetical protein